MKLRLLPVLITFVVSSSVLFGGWFAYHSMAMEDPFIREVTSVEGIQNVSVELDREQATVRLELNSGSNLRDAYRSVEKIGNDVFGKRKLSVEVKENSSDTLERLWSKALFDVAQAMETKQYSRIPERLNELTKANEALEAVTEMDESNVYITLKDGAHHKYIVLPRTPVMMGVWPHE